MGVGGLDTAMVGVDQPPGLGTREVESGSVRIRKDVEVEDASEPVDRLVEDYDGLERVAPAEGDSGRIETLPDGSISVPILEEEIVVTKRLVVRERVIVRKRVTTEHHVVEAELRKERVTIEGDVEEIEQAPPPPA